MQYKQFALIAILTLCTALHPKASQETMHHHFFSGERITKENIAHLGPQPSEKLKTSAQNWAENNRSLLTAIASMPHSF